MIKSNPSPVFAALDAIHGHFANAILTSKLFDREVTFPAVENSFDPSHLGSCELKAFTSISLFHLVGFFCRTVLLVIDHFLECDPAQIRDLVVKFVVIKVNHILLPCRSSSKENFR